MNKQHIDYWREKGWFIADLKKSKSSKKEKPKVSTPVPVQIPLTKNRGWWTKLHSALTMHPYFLEITPGIKKRREDLAKIFQLNNPELTVKQILRRMSRERCEHRIIPHNN